MRQRVAIAPDEHQSSAGPKHPRHLPKQRLDHLRVVFLREFDVQHEIRHARRQRQRERVAAQRLDAVRLGAAASASVEVHADHPAAGPRQRQRDQPSAASHVQYGALRSADGVEHQGAFPKEGTLGKIAGRLGACVAVFGSQRVVDRVLLRVRSH